MKPELILQSDILDILFEHRNKEYGAYSLRRGYNKRLTKAMAGVLLLVAGIFLMSHLNRSDNKLHSVSVGLDIDTVTLMPPPKTDLPPSIEPPRQKIASIRNPTFVLTNDPDADTLPTIEQMDKDVVIGLKTQDGIPAISDISPPDQPAEKIDASPVEAPREKATILDRAELMPEFPGGQAAFIRFLSKNLRMPDDAVQPGQKIKILVRFVVGKEGELSNIQFLETHGEVFEQEVLRVMKKMPKWKPGRHNGESVQVYFKLPIVFDAPVE